MDVIIPWQWYTDTYLVSTYVSLIPTQGEVHLIKVSPYSLDLVSSTNKTDSHII